MYPMWRYVNATLVAWAIRKYKRYETHKVGAGQMLENTARKRPRLFLHWHQSKVGAFCLSKPYDARVSRTVLRAAGGAIPSADSPFVLR